MLGSNNPVEQECNAVLAMPCPYKEPPFFFLGGHKFCPCVCKAIQAAYRGGYKDGKAGREPEIGIETVDPKDES